MAAMAQSIGGYYKGDHVETHSLSKDDFNGLLCLVVDFKEGDGRIVVEIPQSVREAASTPMPETINLKPANLKLSQAGAEREEAEKRQKEDEDEERQQQEERPNEGQESAKTAGYPSEKHEAFSAEEQAATLKKGDEEPQRQDEEKPDVANAATEATCFALGDNVELHSLSTASLNGQRGKVVGLPDAQADRLRVDLGKLGVKAFKAGNLKIVEATPEELMWMARLTALQKVAFVQVPSGWDPKPVLMAVVSALAPCGDAKARSARIGDIVMTVAVERRICPELSDQPMTLWEVMGGLEIKNPKQSSERRKEIWNNLEKKDRPQLESMSCSSRQMIESVGSEGETKADDNRAWTLKECECARVVEVYEDGDFALENPRGLVSELCARSRFGFVGANELSKSAGGYVLAKLPNLLPARCRVRSFGLSVADNNGLEGIVENYYKEKGRYEVKFGEKSMALKPSNLLQLVDVKLATGNESVDASLIDFDSATSDFLLNVNVEMRRAQFNTFILRQTAHADGCFRNGARVIVHSLAAEAAKQWNEGMGEVVGYDKDAQRYVIQVSPTAQLRIKPDNLRFCPL